MILSLFGFSSFKGSCFGLRWFTPASEVSLCGHATLASAAVLFNKISNMIFFYEPITEQVFFFFFKSSLFVMNQSHWYQDITESYSCHSGRWNRYSFPKLWPFWLCARPIGELWSLFPRMPFCFEQELSGLWPAQEGSLQDIIRVSHDVVSEIHKAHFAPSMSPPTLRFISQELLLLLFLFLLLLLLLLK